MNLSKPLVEAIKEFARTFILGEIMVLIAVLGIVKSGINVEIGTFVVQWNVALATFASSTIGVVMTALPSAVDKWLHEKDVKTPLDLKSFDALKK